MRWLRGSRLKGLSPNGKPRSCFAEASIRSTSRALHTLGNQRALLSCFCGISVAEIAECRGDEASRAELWRRRSHCWLQATCIHDPHVQ